MSLQQELHEPGKSNSFSGARRRLIKLTPLILLSGCDFTSGNTTGGLLRNFQQFNDWVQEKAFDINKPAPEFSDDQLTAEEGFRVNDYDTDEPDIDQEHWHLTVEGLVSRQGTYTLSQISSLPKFTKNFRHCCVEGWSMIPQWGGARMKDFFQQAGVDLTAKYVVVECGDGYYTSYDMASVLHAQTLLAYEAYKKPLSLQHGAPLRIIMPTKLGYKSAKWINKIIVTNEKPGGYWEDQGYDWFAGL